MAGRWRRELGVEWIRTDRDGRGDDKIKKSGGGGEREREERERERVGGRMRC